MTNSEYLTMGTAAYVPRGTLSSVAVVKGSDVDNDPGRVDLLQGNLGPKRGHKCCGGCCDVRRAVIVVDLVRIGMDVVGLNLWLYGLDPSDALISEYTAAYAFVTVVILTHVCGIVGAIHYNMYLVGAPAIMCCLGGILSALVAGNVYWLVLAGIFLYPHVMLIQEIREGIMTKENYVNERFSCCCV